MHLLGFEASLQRRIFGILVAAAPLAAIPSACSDDAGSDAGCNSCFCGKPLPPGPSFSVTYAPCVFVEVDASDDAAFDAGAVVCEACQQVCEKNHAQQIGEHVFCTGEEDAGTEQVAHCQISYICGRRFDGLVDVSAEDFARAAWLEAASIHAFRRLARELRAHGAPEELVAAARSAAKDEARHARAMARLAKRRGAKVPRVVYEKLPIRDLESVARENAVEACVGETYGALVAEWHARHARDAEVREAMRAIAPDEMRHAALGWAVDAWARTRLSDDARARVTAARDEAARDLLQNASIADDTSRLASAMHTEIWA